MGIPPSDLKYITPYEFNLIREGFAERRKADLSQHWEQARLVAYTVYSNITAFSGEDPKPIEEWFSLKIDQDRKQAIEALPKAKKVDSKYKAELEAKMNAIP